MKPCEACINDTKCSIHGIDFVQILKHFKYVQFICKKWRFKVEKGNTEFRKVGRQGPLHPATYSMSQIFFFKLAEHDGRCMSKKKKENKKYRNVKQICIYYHLMLKIKIQKYVNKNLRKADEKSS